MISALWLVIIVPASVMVGMMLVAILGINDDDDGRR